MMNQTVMTLVFAVPGNDCFSASLGIGPAFFQTPVAHIPQ
jgi:hypothetical protein